MLKQNKFISIISIVGTALAIMMIMTIIVSHEIRNISIAPESNRDRTLYIVYDHRRLPDGGHMNGTLRVDVIERYLIHLQTPQYLSPVSENHRMTVNVEGSTDFLQFSSRYVGAGYWNIFAFDFIEGEPFSEIEVQSGIRTAVISETVAQALFGGERAVGRTIQLDFENFRVSGVVRDIPPVFGWVRSDIWIPFTILAENLGVFDRFGSMLLLAENRSDFPDIIAEVRDVQRRLSLSDRTSGLDEWVSFLDIRDHRTNSMGVSWSRSEEEFRRAVRVAHTRRIVTFAFLLLIPALNLSGFSLSRIKKRTAEIGVRKAFGAKKHTILIQVLYENLITSLIGGFIGLILSYIVIFQLRGWLLGVPDDSIIPINTLFAPMVFISVFIVCVLLNLLSAGLSAWQASRMSIVNSLKKNDN